MVIPLDQPIDGTRGRYGRYWGYHDRPRGPQPSTITSTVL